MALSIHVSDFRADGIKVIPATGDDFDALARPLIGRVADIGIQLKPLLFVVSNESEHTIVSFSKPGRFDTKMGARRCEVTRAFPNTFAAMS